MSVSPQAGSFGTPAQIEVLASIEDQVTDLIEDHKQRRTLWFPNEVLPASFDNTPEQEAQLAQIRDRARGIPDPVRVAVALNLLTEEGLPHFHRLISVHMGPASPWSDWNYLWTAEEDRHGCLLRDYVRDARLFEMGALEKLQYQYIEAGFDPEWDSDPYRLLAYTSLQEKATQVSHANTGRLAGKYEPVLRRSLAHLAADEGRHYQFYRSSFAAVLEADPDQALESLNRVALDFAMPGNTIDGFEAMSHVVRKSDIFGPRQYQKIVADLLEFWNVGSLTGLRAVGAQAQEALMKLPARLNRLADYAERKSREQSFRFDFLGDRAVAM